MQDGELRQHGMSKEGLIARQFMLGLVQTDQGVPLYHEVFEGNTAEVGTLQASLEKVMKRFGVERVIAVADRGLLSIDNLEALHARTQSLPCHHNNTLRNTQAFEDMKLF